MTAGSSIQVAPLAVLFDLDNTLTASLAFAAGTLVEAAAAHGQQLDFAEVASYGGALYIPLLQQLLNIDEVHAREIYATYVERFGSTMAGRLEASTGADDIVQALRARGIRLGLVTNKMESLAGDILALFGWRSAFGVIVGQDTRPFQKPHPEPALFALATLECDPAQAAFIGDATADIKCGRDAGIPILIGLLGTESAEELQAAGATHICENLAEASELLLGSS